ncbi:hypothetical protein [Caballeronia sp. SBC1]|uniref:hypothetical protein n=1 Tax=Caballeronia sp. SBC1 TaxID=2705548 RepID=UPI00140A0AD4|nr:hypothetical protein [Caballeronia sp. SBC1]
MTKLLGFITAVATAIALATGCSTKIEGKIMPKDFSLEGFQTATSSHPGTITFIESWNDVPKRKTADDYPDSFKFLCLDENEKEVSRDKAKWCIPIVEFDVFSVDDNGKSVPFKEASSISITAYGPDHRFVRSLSTAPRPPSPAAPVPKSGSAMPPNIGDASRTASSTNATPLKSAPSVPQSSGAVQDKTQTTFWERLKRTIRDI